MLDANPKQTPHFVLYNSTASMVTAKAVLESKYLLTSSSFLPSFSVLLHSSFLSSSFSASLC